MKVLIYFDKKNINHSGGPSGYLFPFLKYQNVFIKSFELCFLEFNDTRSVCCEQSKDKRYKRIIEHVKPLYLFLKYVKTLVSLFLKVSKKYSKKAKLISCVNLSDYDAVIFHSTFDLYSCKQSLESYHGTVFLQSHSPKAPYQELLEDVGFPYMFFRRRIEEVDRFAFSRADYLIFPCIEAEEPYLLWRYYRKHINYFRNKTKYILTCIDNVNIDDIPYYGLRDKFSISKDIPVICFVGRHCKTKGYDVLKQIGKRFKNRKDIVFVVLGRYRKKDIPNYTNWIEIGFTDDVLSIEKEVDFCINLNKTTYFDIGLLEQLQLGKNILLSNTGGNKKIIDIYKKLVTPINNKQDAVSALNLIANNAFKKNSEKELQKIYARHFDVLDFINKFQSIILDSIMKLD